MSQITLLQKNCILAGLLIISLLIAGCFTASIYVKVNPDTTISNYKVTIETTSMVYNVIVGQIKSNFDPDLFNYEEKWTGDKVIILLTSKTTLESTDQYLWRIEKTADRMIYEDKRLISERDEIQNEYSEAVLNSISFHYYLEMPGKIIDSNANKIDNNKAEWHLQGSTAFSTPIYAVSELPAFSIPGFDVILAFFGIIFSLFLIDRKTI